MERQVDQVEADAYLPLAVRAWTAGTPPRRARREAGEPRVKRRYEHEALVFDTETLDEPGQRLMVGVWRFYRDNLDALPGTTCIEEGLFYPDDLATTDPAGFALLRDYATTHSASVAAGFSPELKLWPVSRWLEARLFEYGYRHRDRCATVGFNFPFDLGALASYYSPAQGKSRGGWSLGVWGRFDAAGKWHDKPDHPRLLMRSIDPRRTLLSWGPPNGKPNADEAAKGGPRFVDLRTLSFALTDRSLTLEGACTLFGQPYVKREVTYGVLTGPMLDYAREDVGATADLYAACLNELAEHPGVALEPQRLYSPASVGTEYLRAMGVDEPLTRHTNLTPELLGDAMSAFYGGRAEARIVRTPLPVVVADFTSMYPAQNGLLDTWPILTADRLTTEDVTDHVQALVADPDLVERLYDPATWRDAIGVTFVELDDIDGAILPVRARYEPPNIDDAADDALDGGASGNLGIGVNPLHYEGRLVYALPDVLAAVVLGPPAFTVRRATRIRGAGRQALEPVRLRGTSELDPTERDPFVAMIEERHRVRNDPSLMGTPTQKRLDQFLKITANATAYGSLARFDRRDLAKPRDVVAYGPADVAVETKTPAPEDPGPYCFPPVAASITAGARLMLALIERGITDAGGSYAFMDTDSAAIVATPDGGTVMCPGEPGDELPALSHEQVYAILDRFTALNLFGDAVANPDPRLQGCPWKVEHDSIANPLNAYVIAAKRYILYRDDTKPNIVVASDGDDEETTVTDALGTPGDRHLVNWSEHGLGLYQDPLGARDEKGRRVWMREAWAHLLDRALGRQSEMPTWGTIPAITRFTMSSPRQLNWFGRKSNGAPDAATPRPGGFGLLAQTDSLTTRPGRTPIPAASFSSDPQRWRGLDWYDRSTGRPITLATADPDQSPARFADQLMSGAVSLRTLGQVVDRYLTRPEHKSLAPDGVPAGPDTVGKLRRRPVHGHRAKTLLIGKEGNKLLERAAGPTADASADVTVYGSLSDEWEALILPVLRRIGAKEVARQVGMSERRVRPWLTDGIRPHAGSSRHLQEARAAAVQYASEQLAALGIDLPSTTTGVLLRYARLHE